MRTSSFGAMQHMGSRPVNANALLDDQNDMRKSSANLVDARTKRRMFQAAEVIRLIRGGMIVDCDFNGLAS